jgi:hypothetical protein
MQQGNPYGVSYVARKGSELGEVELRSARFQGRRMAEVARKLI